MKILRHLATAALSINLLTAVNLFAENANTAHAMQNIKFAVVNFKNCVDQSLQGKEEQKGFEALRAQMEESLEKRENELTDLSNKFSDADYLDSLSPEAETELKRKFRQLSQEFGQIQNQYYQALSQANMKIIQKLQEAVVAASNAVAQENGIDVVLNEESTFFYNIKYDISSEVVAKMNKNYEKEQQENKEIKPIEL